MSDLLLEIGLEEVPAKFMPPALAELAKSDGRNPTGRSSVIGL